MTDTLLYTPERDGYTFVSSYPITEVKLEAGPSRRRRDHLGATHTVNLTWQLVTPEDYTRFMGFFRSTLEYGTLSFLTDIVTDVGIAMPHRCRCIGDLPKLTQQRGPVYWVAATLEVEPNLTFTGNIIFDASGESIQILGSDPFPDLVSVGESILITGSAGVHEDNDTAINLDGTYEVLDLDPGILILDTPSAVASDWTVLAGLTPDTYAFASRDIDLPVTVVRIPT